MSCERCCPIRQPVARLQYHNIFWGAAVEGYRGKMDCIYLILSPQLGACFWFTHHMALVWDIKTDDALRHRGNLVTWGRTAIKDQVHAKQQLYLYLGLIMLT